MPYANNKGVKIYYEVEGEGPPLVLAHGASGDMTMFRRMGYVDSLNGDCTLVLVDVRGHGQSDKPHELSAYGPEMAIRMAEDIVSVLDDLKIAKASYFGYSMGAMVGFRAARIYGNRFRGFVLGGMSPYEYPEAWIKMNSEFAETLIASLNGLESALSYRERSLGRPLTSEEKSGLSDWIQGKDVPATAAVLASMINVIPLSDDDLSTINIPFLVFAGELDAFYEGAKESTSHLPQSKFVSLPGLDHIPAFARSDLVLPHIKDFLARVENKGA